MPRSSLTRAASHAASGPVVASSLCRAVSERHACLSCLMHSAESACNAAQDARAQQLRDHERARVVCRSSGTPHPSEGQPPSTDPHAARGAAGGWQRGAAGATSRFNRLSALSSSDLRQARAIRIPSPLQFGPKNVPQASSRVERSDPSPTALTRRHRHGIDWGGRKS